MHYQILTIFLCLVTEIITVKLYIITANNEEKFKLYDKIKDFRFNRLPKEELRSEYETRLDKNICNRHFGSIFGAKAQKMLCLENYYEERKRNKQPYKRKWKENKQLYKKPFEDLTRGLTTKSFSADYIDINDFVRSMDDDGFSKDYLDVGDLARDDSIESRRTWSYKTKLNKNKARTKGEESDTSDEGSDVDHQNRFQVIDNKSSESDSGSDSEDESKAKFLYLQGKNRLVKDGRKRLQHFLPKRFHWDSEETKNLGYYWINGRRGIFAEAMNLH